MSIGRVSMLEFVNTTDVDKAEEYYHEIREKAFPTAELVVNIRTGPASLMSIAIYPSYESAESNLAARNQYHEKIKANLKDTNFLEKNKQFIVNKIGHALHDLDEVFYKFSHNEKLDLIARAIGFVKPQLLQSMYIFKQPKIGGEVVCHQDSTFLYTEPESAVGFWFALQDATRENGCLQVAKGGHKGPLRKLFTKVNNKMMLKELSNDPFPSTDTLLEVKKGTLVLLHGRLPHYSSENRSLDSRHAYTLHIIEGNAKYPRSNWLQRTEMPLKGFIND